MHVLPEHPVIQRWFADRLGEPTEPQHRGWPLIRAGKNVLIAAPTGSGKTLAAFLSAIEGLFRQGAALRDETQVLYVSPLKALSNDVQKNLSAPLAEIRALDPTLPEVRVLVRTGDTAAKDRASMRKQPPHILVTTPESLYVLLGSEGGRAMLATVRTVVVDEIHALVRDKRGSHLALSLERLESLAGPFQRIGLSATQKPLSETASFLAGHGRDAVIVDAGHLRVLDLAVEIPRSPLSTVCSHEVWQEIYERMVELIREHKTTLVFVNTRKMAERIAARLREVLGEDVVTSHHGSLSRELRLAAEQRLKAGELRALVATASLELGIDVGDVDLAIQVGMTPSIATFLQRVGRAGHGLDRVPKGRLFALTIEELVASAALLRAVRGGDLDRTTQPAKPLDILAQQIVAACASQTWDEDALYDSFRRAWPYRDLTRDEFDRVVCLHTQGRGALLHRDGVGKRLMATKRARLTALMSGGAIPDQADYQVLLEPEGTLIGTLNEDFAIESNSGDIFQLGNASWRIIRVEPGRVRVADAKGSPPTIPFWLGEAPARTQELSAMIATVREHGTDGTWLAAETGIPEAAATQITGYLREGIQALGTVPTQDRIVLERFFDETGGMQLVMHAPFGGRINRALGLALRKRFCRSFGFELQAAANEEAIVLSLGPMQSFELAEVFDYLKPATARDVLVQAMLVAPMFQTRWRWNASRSLLLERSRNGKKVPSPLLRMRADDLLAKSWPQIAACAETLPGGDLPVPMEHPIVAQTVEDCLHEAMDVDGFLEVLTRIADGRIERVAVDTPEPSAFARGVLSAAPYAFLDDAPLEERRTQAVMVRRGLDPKTADELGALDPDAVRRVREEAWPRPADAEEVHEALGWMGYVTVAEGAPWSAWLAELAAAGRAQLEGDRWFATEATREPLAVLRGRMEALGPVFADDPLLVRLEGEGVVLRVRLEGRQAWCNRRLLARIHRYTIERLRNEIAPVTAAQFLKFLASWQHVAEDRRLEGPAGLFEVVRQLAAFEVPAAAWERNVLPARLQGFRRDWLDQLTLSGSVVWGRLWGSGAGPIRNAPICLMPREDARSWLALRGKQDREPLPAPAAAIHEALAKAGASFPLELERATRLLPSQFEQGLANLVAAGLATCDSFAALRQLVVAPSRRSFPLSAVGRWSLLAAGDAEVPDARFVAERMLRRYGVIFRKVLLRERHPVPWRDLVRACRIMELAGDVRGGRFVAGFEGEQYALPEAVPLLRQVRRAGDETPPIEVSAADPLNMRGILTPDERVSPMVHQRVRVG